MLGSWPCLGLLSGEGDSHRGTGFLRLCVLPRKQSWSPVPREDPAPCWEVATLDTHTVTRCSGSPTAWPCFLASQVGIPTPAGSSTVYRNLGTCRVQPEPGPPLLSVNICSSPSPLQVHCPQVPQGPSGRLALQGRRAQAGGPARVLGALRSPQGSRLPPSRPAPAVKHRFLLNDVSDIYQNFM